MSEGLLETVVPADVQSLEVPSPPPAPVGGQPAQRQLPQRLPGASGITDVLPLRPVAERWRPPQTYLAKHRARGGNP